MRLVWNEHGGQNLLDWFVARLPVQEEWPPESCRAAGFVDSEGQLLGVVVFHHWSVVCRRVQVSAAAADARWTLARKCWGDIYSYAFDTMNCIKMYAHTPLANERAVRFLTAVGMEPKAVLEHHLGPGVHAVYSERTVWQHRGIEAPAAVTPEQWEDAKEAARREHDRFTQGAHAA